MKLFYLLLCMWFVGCINHQPENNDARPPGLIDQFNHLDTILQNGDLVLRSDDDIVGLSLRNMNDSDKTYSHSGFAFKEDSNWYVYNMMAGEENPTMQMRRDPLRNYIDPNNKSGFAVYRYALNADEINSLHDITTQQFRQNLLFDTAFNLADDTTMYCSELIAKNLLAATNGRIKIPTTYKENFSFKATARGRQAKQNLRYIAIDNLFLNDDCVMIIRKKFRQQ